MTRLARYLLAAIGIAALALSYSIMARAAVIVSVTHGAKPVARATAQATAANPIVFVSQVAVPGGFATISSAFANHMATIARSGRGGDLWIKYADGTQRNLTAEAGYGVVGMQGASAIGVRDPAVSWDAQTVVFSMVVGAPVRQYQEPATYWQLYTVTGLGEGQHATIARVANQPATANNVQPTYLSDGTLIFASDLASTPAPTPQLDEYETTPTVTGLWHLTAAGTVEAFGTSPSGDQHPFVDSYGRVISSQWNHLQRDQQCDSVGDAGHGTLGHGCYNTVSETDQTHVPTPPSGIAAEVFPEPRLIVPGSTTEGLTFNDFFPWARNQDGTSPEIVDHSGRHDLIQYFDRSFNDDPNLHEFNATNAPYRHSKTTAVVNWFSPAADPTTPGHILGISAPEFYSDAAGQIVAMQAPPGVSAETIGVEYLTDVRAATNTPDGQPTPPGFEGRYRDPQMLTDGRLIAAWTPNSEGDENIGTAALPKADYQFRIRYLTKGADGLYHPGDYLTSTPISKEVSYWDPNALVTYTGATAQQWEIEPVEVVARAVPPTTTTGLQQPELTAFANAQVDPAAFIAWLRDHNMGVFVSRDVTSRDRADQQQPYNLRVPGGVSTIGNSGKLYDISYMQLFQDDAIRGESNGPAGRRLIAQPLHDATALGAMPPVAGAPAGSVKIAPDGSIAAIVPADRAMTWQTTAADGTPVVRERYWIDTRPGEIRTCDSCHGVNTANQAGNPPPTNVPQALTTLVAYWQQHQGPPPPMCTNAQPDQTPLCADGSHETGGTWSRSDYPACVWTYADGQCPVVPPPAKLTATIKQGGKRCTLNALLPFAWVATPNPRYVPPGGKPTGTAPPSQYLLSITQGTTTCQLPAVQTTVTFP